MVRELRKEDINKVADIWLDTNIKTHSFIPAQYWKSNFEFVKELLLQATVYVYEDGNKIQGFIGLNDEYVEGIFVSDKMQSQGIGGILLNYAKDRRNRLFLLCLLLFLIHLFCYHLLLFLYFFDHLSLFLYFCYHLLFLLFCLPLEQQLLVLLIEVCHIHFFHL